MAFACGNSASSPTDPSTGRIADADLQLILAEANTFTASLISDGYVSPEEYEAAVLRTIQCYDEHNVVHSEPYFQERRFGDGRWEYTYEQRASTEEDRIECFESFEYPVLLVWMPQFKRTEAQRQQIEEEFVKCANDGGIDGSTRSEIELAVDRGLGPELMQEYVRCLVLAEQGRDINDPP